MTEGLSDYEIVYPARVDERDRPLVKKSHYHKRSVSNYQIVGKTGVMYIINAFGKTFHLNLTSSGDFVVPDYLSVRINDNTSWLDDSHSGLHCFYSGIVNGRTDREGARLNLCGGMVRRSLFYLNPSVSQLYRDVRK